MQVKMFPFDTGKQKVSSPKASTGGRKMKTSSVDNPDEAIEERKQLENQSESVERNEEYDSDSSSSEDDDDMPGLTEEEEKERQREKREKVKEFLTPCYVVAIEQILCIFDNWKSILVSSL